MQETTPAVSNHSPYIIRPMRQGDCKVAFALADERHKPLKIFFRRNSERASAQLITQTYVAVPEDPADRRILGFISLMSAEIALGGTYSVKGKPRADRYPSQPAIRIARLAVADGTRGSGIGRDLLSLSLSIAVDRVCTSVGCRFLITNAKQESVGFYGKQGFTMLDTDSNRASPAPVMWLDLQPYVPSSG